MASQAECERWFETYVVIFTYIFRCSGKRQGCQIEIKTWRQTHFKNSQTQQKFAKLLEMVASLPKYYFF